jgi:glycosyltransferase involved in cell wall biosynthesis
MFLILKSMASSGYRVTLLPLTDATAKQPETDILTQTGVEVLWDSAGMREVLQLRQDAYDIIIISRPHNAVLALGLARETNPRARVIYDAEALWYRREQLRRRLGLSPTDPRFESEEAELSILRSADHIITVSEEEKRIIEEKVHEKSKIMLWGHPHALNPTKTAYEQRSGILFVGGFMSSPAHNDDAVIYFANAMLPRIQERIPGCRFIVAGSNPPESIRRLSSNSIIVTGYLKDLRQVYEKSRIFVAPIRFAAGAMWKVTEAMSHGLPCVLSTIAAQGIAITDGEEALVANDEKDFIEKSVRLYQDNALWNHIRKRELEYIANNNDPALMDKRLREFLEGVVSRPVDRVEGESAISRT